MTERSPRFHLSLRASRDHFDAMVAFYSTLFGTAPAKLKPDYAKFEPLEPSVNFTLNSVPEVAHGDIDHLGIQVWSDAALIAARDRIKAAGYRCAKKSTSSAATPDRTSSGCRIPTVATWSSAPRASAVCVEWR